MTTTLDTAYIAIQILSKDFAAYTKKYFLSDYSESQARTDFIDKFFTALGWDVHHTYQKNPFEQEVKVERNVNIGLSQKRADYAFFVEPNFRDVRFYVEAKKPSSLLTTSDNYFQTIRYGWNSSTPLAVLTDFQHLHILDCRNKPDIDTALQRAVFKFHYTDYADPIKFAEIYYLLSHEAVINGSLEKRAEALPKLRGKAVQKGLFKGGYQSIDEVFIQDLESMRETLAKSLKSANPDLTGEILTEITQRILDRLIFLRFLEDKLIETGERVSNFGDKGSVWGDFLAASRRLDARYNGVVFKPHKKIDNDNNFVVDDDVFGNICETLADVNSPYDFNVIPIHILGSIYERFLGKVIVTTEKRAKLVQKPEVRRSGGVYYTPEYIVRYIVENTVGKLVEGKNPTQIAEMRFADIACGSGSFLLGVFDLLLRHHATWYNSIGKDRAKLIKNGTCIIGDDNTLHLSLAKRREILLNNIYGVDIDNQAVEVAQLSLYLKLLEEETTATARNYQVEMGVTILPSLNDNIVNGNSLIGTEIFDTDDLFEIDREDQVKLNPMDFSTRFNKIFKKQGGFDAIIGNPPYDVLEKDRRESSWPHYLLAEYVRKNEAYENALGGKLNLYRFFVIRMLQLTKNQGRVGMIVPNSLLADISCARTRRHLILSANEIEMDCFPQKDNANRRVFIDAKLSTVIITAKKQDDVVEKTATLTVRVYPWNKFEDDHSTCLLNYKDVIALDPNNLPIPLVDQKAWEICKKIHKKKNVVRLDKLGDFIVRRGEINQTVYREFISSNPKHAPLLKGAEVGRYIKKEKLKQGTKEWFDEASFLQNNDAKPIATFSRIATQRITGVDEYWRVVCTIIHPKYYFADSTNSITQTGTSQYELEYILAILNSRLIQWRFSLTSTNNNVGTNELESLPIRRIDFSIKDEKDKHDQLVKAASQTIEMKISLMNSTSDRDINYYKGRCDNLDQKINELVYELYGLADTDIALIEAKTR